MNLESIDKQRYLAWPFWLLGLEPSASNSDIEKAAREIEAKIQFKVPNAERYKTPFGDFNRDSFEIREAKAALQEPNSRLLAEFWYLSESETENNCQETQKNSDSTLPSTEKRQPNLIQLARKLKVLLWA